MKALSNKMRILGAKLKHEEIGSKEFFALQKKQISLIVEWSNARVASLRQMLDLPIRQAGFSSYPQPVKKSGYYGVVPDLRPYYRGKSLYYQCFDWHIDLEVSPLTEEKRHELYEKFKESDLSHIPSFFKAYIKAVKMSEKTLNELRKKYSDLIWLSLSEDSDRVLNDPEFFNFLEGANTALLNLGHDSLDRIAAECEKIVEPELKKKMLEFLSAEVTLNHFNVNHHRDRRCID